MGEMEDKLVKNWGDSSAGYGSSIRGELDGPKRAAWLNLIIEGAGGPGPFKILDVGTGPGFFPIILTEAGHEVTGIDAVESMLEEARANAAARGLAIDFRLADSQNLPFDSDLFDLGVSRNVAWTLLDPEAAYREWLRVLKAGGRTVIFDGNWNLHLFREDYRISHERDENEFRERYPDKDLHEHPLTPEMIEFRRRLPQCARFRPEWDVGALIRAGFYTISVDLDISPRVFDESELLLHRTYPMFSLVAGKRTPGGRKIPVPDRS